MPKLKMAVFEAWASQAFARNSCQRAFYALLRAPRPALIIAHGGITSIAACKFEERLGDRGDVRKLLEIEEEVCRALPPSATKYAAWALRCNCWKVSTEPRGAVCENRNLSG